MPTVPTDEPQGLRVSVILVSFNQVAALRRAIHALEQSKYRPQLEILVADCGSHDGSEAIDAEFPPVNMLRLPHHVGAVRAMNIATRTAKADLLFYLSPAVEVEFKTVVSLADKLDADPAAIGGCPLLVDPAGSPANRLYRLPDRAAVTAAARGADLERVPVPSGAEASPVDFPGLEALMIRKLFIRSMNYFDQRFGHYWADADLAVQVRRAGKRIFLYPDVRVTLHPEPDPLQNQKIAETDRVSGAVAFTGKYEGSGAALGLRISLALGALARFDLGRVGAVLGGAKLDGGQGR